MGRQRWTTPAQEQFLVDLYSDYEDAKANKCLQKSFIQKAYAKWEEQWPARLPTSEEIENAKTDNITEEKAKDTAQKKIILNAQQRLLSWWSNQPRATRGGRSKAACTSNGPSTLLSLSVKKKCQPWQAYYAMENSTLKPLALAKWRNHNETNETSIKFVLFLGQWAKKKLDKESDKVKSKVEEYRNNSNEFSILEETKAERNTRYNNAISKVLRTIQSACNAITLQTEWCATIIVGGPHPARGGRIQLFIAHSGMNEEEEDFKDYLGVEQFQTHISAPFSDFVEDVFGTEEDLVEWALSSANEVMAEKDSPEGTSSVDAPKRDATHNGTHSRGSGTDNSSGLEKEGVQSPPQSSWNDPLEGQ